MKSFLMLIFVETMHKRHTKYKKASLLFGVLCAPGFHWILQAATISYFQH